MTEYNWHEDFFKRKVYPQICKDAGECAGFYAWLQESDRQLYDEILRLEQLIDEIWKAQKDREAFRQVCRDWYAAVMGGIEKWKKAMGEDQTIEARGQMAEEPKQEAMTFASQKH